MEQITTIGLDIAKSVFQVHGIDAAGAVVVRRQLRRRQVLPFFKKHPACLVGIEACATAHHWAREITALGHEVKLMPGPARDCLLALRDQLILARQQIADADKRILACHREDELSQRLEEIPGVGPLIATALVAGVPDPHVFKSARDLPAWIGLVPKEGSTGGKERPGHISKAGDKYLRSLLMIGAFSLIKRAKLGGGTRRVRLLELMARRPTKVAAIALANKIARIARALMTKGTRYREPTPRAA